MIAPGTPANDAPPTPSPDVVRILCLGDVVAQPGRRVLQELLPGLRQRLGLHMIIANGENSAGGVGITATTASDLFRAGVDVITTGNHVWRHRECLAYIGKEPRLLRPANYPPKAPGRGLGLFTLADGRQVAVLNLLGRVFMDAVDCPFQAAERLCAEAREHTPLILVDFHAEATSEKRALAWFLDGKASFVFGTHTHVQTADPMILPQGTACLTDLGMCGVEAGSVLGMQQETSVRRFTTALPHPFVSAKGEAGLNGALVELDATTGKALAIHLVRRGGVSVLAV